MPTEVALLVGLAKDSRPFFLDAFGAAGVECLVIAHGREGLHRAQKENPIAVVVDWFLPDMTGTAFEVYLRADPATRGIPLAFVNGATWENLIGQLVDSGLPRRLDERRFATLVESLRTERRAKSGRR